MPATGFFAKLASLARPWIWKLDRTPEAENGTARALIDAADQGDTADVESLLRSGVNPDIVNSQGETALHRAVRHGHAETAACLLAYGASYRVADRQGRLPLDSQYVPLETLHAIRQRHRRSRIFRSKCHELSEAVAGWADQLDRHGIVKLSGLIMPDDLTRMQRGFQGFVAGLDRKIARGEGAYRHYDEEEHWWPKDRAYVSNNAFKHSADLVALCCRPELLEIADYYVGRTAFIQRGVAMRYLPSTAADNDMFGWHHDMEEKRLKMLVLLTDVGAHDQTMSYVKGSQQIYHPLEMFSQNTCSLDYCRKHLGQVEIFQTIGQAGDVFLFDSNGAHRGNRRTDARVRDAFFVEFTSDPSAIWGGDIPTGALSGISPGRANPFRRLIKARKKWRQRVTRRSTDWIENLPRIETWL